MVTRASLLTDAVRASGGHARPPAGPSDMVDGVAPGVVVEPTDAQGVSSVLAWASASKLCVIIRGTGSKDGWGRPPRHVDVLLRTGGLRRILAHESSDLTATIEAGARLRDVNRELARHRQWLPLDPPHEDATIGGIVATNDSGPLRHRHGTPRDLVIGLTIVMADGLIAASGGRVVKNVAGYDLARLMAGSHGCLAAIVSATFKLAPLPQAAQSLRVHVASPGDAVAFVERLRHEQCEPEALDLHLSRRGPVERVAVLVRFASVAAAVERAIDQAGAVAQEIGASTEIATGPQADAWWSSQRDVASGSTSCVRLAWKPADFARAAEMVMTATRGLDLELAGRASVGSGLLRLDGEPDQQAAAIAALREQASLRHVVVVHAPADLRRRVEPWPSDAGSSALWGALKDACDPLDTLGAGRGPL